VMRLPRPSSLLACGANSPTTIRKLTKVSQSSSCWKMAYSPHYEAYGLAPPL